MDLQKKNSIKSSDYKNSDMTSIPTFEEVSYNPIIYPYNQRSMRSGILYKDKTLEVLEREFSLKFPGPYQVFIEEQERLRLEFIENYMKNHGEL